MIWLSAFALIAIPTQSAVAFQSDEFETVGDVPNPRIEIGQVSAERGREIAIDQAPHSKGRQDDALEQALPIGPRAISGGQIDPDEERGSSDTVAAQLQAVSEPGADAVVQLAGREDSSARDNSISSRREGRTAQTSIPDGPDRCNSETPTERPAVCRAVIETRAAEFRREPRPALSAEERLIVERSELARVRSALATARIGISPGSDDEDGQVLASLLLRPPAPPQNPQPDDPELGAETQTLIDAIVSGLTLPAVPQP